MAGWLEPGGDGGKVFVHVFSHRWLPYLFSGEAWLANLDARRDEVLAVLRESGRSAREARRLVGTWRLFLLSTEVMWRYRGGSRWGMSQYLLEARK